MIINGRRVRCNAPVITWKDPGGLKIRPPRGAGVRAKTIDKFVLHWTGGEGDASTVWRTLVSRGRRGLGVDWIIDREGVIYQLFDPCVHYGYQISRSYNERSLAVEIVNFGFKWPVWLRSSLRKAPRRGRDRVIYECRFRRTKHYIADFYPAQKEALFELVRTVLQQFPNIEPKVPKDPVTGEYKHYTLPRQESVGFSGILGHYHISKRKTDPGPLLIEEVGQFIDKEVKNGRLY